MSRRFEGRMARLARSIPAPPPPRVPEPDLPADWLGITTIQQLLDALAAQDPEGARQRRAELDNMSDEELLAEFQRR